MAAPAVAQEHGGDTPSWAEPWPKKATQVALLGTAATAASLRARHGCSCHPGVCDPTDPAIAYRARAAARWSSGGALVVVQCEHTTPCRGINHRESNCNSSRGEGPLLHMLACGASLVRALPRTCANNTVDQAGSSPQSPAAHAMPKLLIKQSATLLNRRVRFPVGGASRRREPQELKQAGALLGMEPHTDMLTMYNTRQRPAWARRRARAGTGVARSPLKPAIITNPSHQQAPPGAI